MNTHRLPNMDMAIPLLRASTSLKMPQLMTACFEHIYQTQFTALPNSEAKLRFLGHFPQYTATGKTGLERFLHFLDPHELIQLVLQSKTHHGFHQYEFVTRLMLLNQHCTLDFERSPQALFPSFLILTPTMDCLDTITDLVRKIDHSSWPEIRLRFHAADYADKHDLLKVYSFILEFVDTLECMEPTEIPPHVNRLKSLSIMTPKFNWESWKRAYFNSLEHLYLSFEGGQGVKSMPVDQLFAHMPRLSHLELILPMSLVISVGFKLLESNQYQNLQSLTSLSLIIDTVRYEDAITLDKILSGMSTLSQFAIQSMALQDITFLDSIADILETLEISDSIVHSEALLILPGLLSSMPRLKVLILSGNQLSNIDFLARTHFKSLEELDLRNNALQSFPCLQIPTLKVLKLSGTHFNEKHQMKQFFQCPHRSLDLVVTIESDQNLLMFQAKDFDAGNDRFVDQVVEWTDLFENSADAAPVSDRDEWDEWEEVDESRDLDDWDTLEEFNLSR
jgi:Leucine-rich repeat (LRR) protein